MIFSLNNSFNQGMQFKFCYDGKFNFSFSLMNDREIDLFGGRR